MTQSALPPAAIRPAEAADCAAMWTMFEPVPAGGDSYPMQVDTDRAAARA